MIEFDQVSMVYENEYPSLRNVSLTIDTTSIVENAGGVAVVTASLDPGVISEKATGCLTFVSDRDLLMVNRSGGWILTCSGLNTAKSWRI